MVWYRSGVRVGLKLAASIMAGTGLVASFSGWTADPASAKNRREVAEDGVVASRPAGTPVMAIVSLSQQRVTLYDMDGPILQAPVSTGQTGYETPAGIYSVLEKKAEHYSNLYDDASMPFMQRLTWSGIALHAGVLPGYPASHGCIRMPLGFAERLFDRTKVGMRVIIVRDDISPGELVHPALFRPSSGEIGVGVPGPTPGPVPGEGATRVATASAEPPAGPLLGLRALAAARSREAVSAAKKAEEARTAARNATIDAARASKAIRRAEAVKARAELQARQAEQLSGPAGSAAAERAQQAKGTAAAALAAAQTQLESVQAEMQPKVDLALQLREQAKEAQEASAAAQEEAKEAARKLSPVSVFISRATQRLYVRQAREPLFESEVAIAHAERPLGTYVFTALNYTDGEADLRWSAVSMYRDHGAAAPEAKRRDRQAGTAPADLAGAKLALERIAIPAQARARISEVVSPGSTLIVSDEPLSRETGKGTDFIVLMSTEPQGGIKIRRRSPSPTPEVRYRYQRPSYGYQRPSSGGSPFGWSGPSFWWQ
jgi:L,D-transpeptidase catalytic domain